MKKLLASLLALAMLLCLAACGEDTPATTGNNPAQTPGTTADTPADTTAGNSAAAPADYLVNAMNAAKSLSGGTYLLGQNGSVYTLRDSSSDGFAATYAAMAGTSELAVSVSEFRAFALGGDGALYFKDKKIAENVIDIAYATTNTNEEGYIITSEGIYHLGSDNAPDGMLWNSRFLRLDASGERKTFTGTPSFVTADRHDFLVLDQKGQIFLFDEIAGKFSDVDCFGWEGLVMAGSMRFTGADDIETHTVAGIQADGTVLAAGDYAQEILSWGPLSYLSMANGVILGVKTDGTVKLTGRYGDILGSIVEGWTGIQAAKVGSHARIADVVITAVDAQGNFHCAVVNHDSLSMSGSITADGCTGDVRCYQYTSDGKTLYADGGAWEAQ